MNHLPYPSPPRHHPRAFIHVEVLLLLVLLPLAAFLYLAAEERRLRDAHRFAGPRGATPDHARLRRLDFVRLIVAAGFIILALARPAWHEVFISSSREGRDLIFLLDVSRSMLAQDLVPDRLGAAKTAIRHCVESLEGDRVALVVFSGSTSILCPLTSDYSFFYDKLEEAHPDFAPPGDVRVGGTRIGDAIHKICDKLLHHDRRGYQDLILLTDGGDQESNPLKAVQRLDTLGVHFLVAGLGDAVTGARIPARPESGSNSPYVLHQGREVWGKLEADGLNTLAKSSRYGIFLNSGTRALPLGDIYQKLASHFQRHHTGNREDLMRKQETFPFFLALALLCLAAPPQRPRPRLRPASSSPSFLSLLALVAASACFLPSPVSASSGPALFQSGLQQLEARNFTGSIDSFRNAAEFFPDSPRRALCLYNAGLAAYHQAHADEVLDPLSSQSYYRQSCALLRAALEISPSLEDARWNLELALRRLSLLVRESDEPTDAEKEPSEESDPANQDSEPSEDEGDPGDSEESSAEGANEPGDPVDGQNAMDLDSQDIPPPIVEPEDIFQQQREDRQTRQKNAPATYRPVERDW